MKWFTVPAIFSFMLIYAGCSMPVPKPMVERQIIVMDLVDKPKVEGAYGTAQKITDTLCHIEIVKSAYPKCITHEVMHCFSGDWHQGYDTTQYCD